MTQKNTENIPAIPFVLIPPSINANFAEPLKEAHIIINSCPIKQPI